MAFGPIVASSMSWAVFSGTTLTWLIIETPYKQSTRMGACKIAAMWLL
jgi:hypothetical protein